MEIKMTYNTEKRSEITDFLARGKGKAFTVDEICHAIGADESGKSTVYRIISKLVKEGTLIKITDEHSRHTTYQYLGEEACCEHLHLKCKECGRLIHLDHETSHLLENQIKSAGHFVLDEGAMLFGRCEGCALAGKECNV